MPARLTPRDPQLLTMALAKAAAAWQAEIAHGRELVRRRTAGRLRLAARARSSSRRRPGGLPALDHGAHDRGIRTSQRSCRSHPGAHQRGHRSIGRDHATGKRATQRTNAPAVLRRAQAQPGAGSDVRPVPPRPLRLRSQLIESAVRGCGGGASHSRICLPRPGPMPPSPSAWRFRPMETVTHWMGGGPFGDTAAPPVSGALWPMEARHRSQG